MKALVGEMVDLDAGKRAGGLFCGGVLAGCRRWRVVLAVLLGGAITAGPWSAVHGQTMGVPCCFDGPALGVPCFFGGPALGVACCTVGESVVVMIDDALGGHQYPWYDADNRSVKPVTPKPGAVPHSTERATVPVAVPTKPKTTAKNATNPAVAGGGGGWGGGETMESVLMVVIGVGIALIVGALVIMFLRIESQGTARSAKPVRSRRQSIEQLPFELDAAEGDFRSVAESAYRDGDLKRAIVYLYSHVLVTLDQHRLIRLRKGKTNRQYLHEVRNDAAIAEYFGQVMEPFEAVFFGNHDMDVQQFRRCWEELGQFHADVQGRGEVIVG